MFEVSKATLGAVIDALLDSKLDHKAVVLKLAKEFPETFLEVIRSQQTPDAWSWGRGIVQSIRDQKLVEAVKALRTEKDLGLKEALDIVVNVQYSMFGQGWVPEPMRECPHLDNLFLLTTANQLKAVAYKLYGA
jgi:hypothetical protein